MSYKLSIIMPCYNCAATLKEAVDSIYTQNLAVPFEVVMVDDASTDNTWRHMQELAKKHSEIRLLQHEKNLGGGAARNTGIKHSAGELIFCLDSDNFFAPNVLQKMVDFIAKKKIDGAAIFERRFFLGNNPKKYSRQAYKEPQYVVRLVDLFNGSGILLDNFLYTRVAYHRTGGYPENHGFDTQCYEARFLSKGLKVGFCPGSIFYHRQKSGQKSYFDRVYESGEYSKNLYLIYEEIFFLFAPSVRRAILEFDIFSHNKLNEENLAGFLSSLYKKDPKNFFIPNYEKYLYPEGFSLYISQNLNGISVEELACRQVYYYLQRQFSASLLEGQKIIEMGLVSKVVLYNLFRAYLGLSGKFERREIESQTINQLQGFSLKKRKMYAGPKFLSRILRYFPAIKTLGKNFLE